MLRTIPYVIPDISTTIEAFLKSKGYSRQNIINLKKNEKDILLNGTPAYMNHHLRAHDILTVTIRENIASPKIPPVYTPLNIIYEDEDILVLNKPAGTPIHPSLNHYENTLANAVAYYYASQNIPYVFRCINRLDKDTSGLTLLAKHMVSGSILSNMVSSRSIVRKYLAIAEGTFTEKEGCISAPIARSSSSIIEREVNFKTGEYAVTHYRVLQEKDGHSLLSVWLETGRTHQIRVHMQYIGHPLPGDFLYNPNRSRIARQALHSHSLSFQHPITDAPMCFEVPLPDDMHALF